MFATGKWRLGVILAILLTFLAVTNVFAARKDVVISEQNWTASTILCQVMKNVLEEKLGVSVKVIQLSGAATWAGMDKGDVDVFSEIWETAEIEGIEKYTGEGGPCEKSLSYPDAPQGWYVPKYVVEEHGIKSIESLKGKTEIFDFNQDGKGDIWVGPSSWKVAEQNKIRIRDYGLDLDPTGVEQWAWLATLKEAYRKKKPVIFYYWEPEWLFTQYELVMIKEPPYDAAKWKYTEKDPENSKITCSFRPTNVWVGYTRALKDREPKAYQFFKNWSIPINEVNNMIALVTDLPDHPALSAADAAKKWVEDHPDIVKGWLKGIQ